MMKIKSVAMFGILSALAACGGGSGGGDNPVAEYATDSDRAARLVAETSASNPTGVAGMPTRGRAEYDGIVGMAFGGQPASLSEAAMIGEVDMNADFATNRITGELDDFNTRSGKEIRGELRMTNGRINGSGFSGDIAGRLTGGPRSPGNVSGNISGDFLGEDAASIAGQGSATSDGGRLGLSIVGRRDRD